MARSKAAARDKELVGVGLGGGAGGSLPTRERWLPLRSAQAKSLQNESSWIAMKLASELPDIGSEGCLIPIPDAVRLCRRPVCAVFLLMSLLGFDPDSRRSPALSSSCVCRVPAHVPLGF